MGIIQKTANFLGVRKLGQGIASAGRIVTGDVAQDVTLQQEADSSVQRLLYAARQEQDAQKKTRLLELANKLSPGNVTPGSIDPGLTLTNKEVLGSAANTALNILTPGAFKGTKAAVLAKNAGLGAAFGAASGLEKNRSASGVVGSATGGAIVGTGIGAVGLLASGIKNFLGNTTPEWLMNKAVKPALEDLKKNVKYGTDTLGRELLNDGVAGGPKKLMEIAQSKLQQSEDELQTLLNSPALSDKMILRDSVLPYLKEVVAQKAKIPGGKLDIKRIEAIFNDLPEQMTLPQANEIKRAIYQELRSPAYKLDAKLTAKAQTLKMIAKGLKTEIETTSGMPDVVRGLNKKLSVYGRLENSMVDQLARELRNNGIGLTDAILASGGWPTTILALLRHTGQGTQTYTAQALNTLGKVGTGITSRTAKSALKRTVLNAP